MEILQYCETEVQEPLKGLIKLTQSHSEIWGDEVQELLVVCSQIIEGEDLELTTRKLALELVRTIAEANTEGVREQYYTIKDKVFTALLTMMSQGVQDANDEKDWAQKEDPQTPSDEDPLFVACQALEKIARVLGPKTVLKCSDILIMQASYHDDWQQRLAGLLFLGMIFDVCQ